MPPVAIDNPILKSPFRDPTRHFAFADDGITSAISKGRRPSSFFIPIAQPNKRGPTAQLTLAGEGWTAERLTPNDFINRVREQLEAWRRSGRPGMTAVTGELLEYWTAPDRTNPLFFCQLQAVETADLWVYVPDRETATTRTLPKELERPLQVIASNGCPHEEPASVTL